jgi:hypothetical protein
LIESHRSKPTIAEAWADVQPTVADFVQPTGQCRRKGAVRHDGAQKWEAHLPTVRMTRENEVEAGENPFRYDIRRVHEPDCEIVFARASDVVRAMASDVGVIDSGESNASGPVLDHLG